MFITDTESVPHKVDGITHLMLEANWSKYCMAEVEEGAWKNDRVEFSHLSLEKAIDWVKGTNLSKLVEVHLIHLSGANSDKLFFKTEMAKVVGCPVYVH